jgi:hypothetical protein
VRSTGGQAGEAAFIRLLAKVAARAIPGIGLVLLAYDVVREVDAGAAGGGKLAHTEARIKAQNTLRQLLLQGDPQHQLLGAMASSPGALLELAQAQARYAEPNTLAALRKGLPLLARLAAAGVQEARQTLQTLTRALDGTLAFEAKAQLRASERTAKPAAPRKPVASTQPKNPPELPPNPGLQPLPSLKTELPPLKIDSQDQAAAQARQEQLLLQERQSFLGRLKEQAKGSQVANNATLSDWVRRELPEKLQQRIEDITRLLQGKPVGNVYEHHRDANGKPVPEARNPNYNQYVYGGVYLKVSDLNHLRKGLQSYLAQLQKAQGSAPGAVSGARIESPGKALGGQAAWDREAALVKRGRQNAIKILETLKPSGWSSQTYEQMLADAIANNQSDPYTAFWLAQLGQRPKPSLISPTAGVQSTDASNSNSDRTEGVNTENTTTKPYTDRSVFTSYPEQITIEFKSIDEQAEFLSQHIPDLSYEQAKAILQAGFSRNSSVVLGGSRLRGNFNDASDLDVGFGNLSERQAQRVIANINGQGYSVQLERLTIVPGKSTATISEILSPEEFFQRTGIRAGGDLNAGKPYYASGSITLTQDGKVLLIPPRQR